MKWVPDPSFKNQPSVTLTLLLITFVITSVLGIAESLEKVKTTGPFVEMLWSFCALYLGRRINFKGSNFSSEKAEEIKEKVE